MVDKLILVLSLTFVALLTTPVTSLNVPSSRHARQIASNPVDQVTSGVSQVADNASREAGQAAGQAVSQASQATQRVAQAATGPNCTVETLPEMWVCFNCLWVPNPVMCGCCPDPPNPFMPFGGNPWTMWFRAWNLPVPKIQPPPQLPASIPAWPWPFPVPWGKK